MPPAQVLDRHSAYASRSNPMICSSENDFFTSNLRRPEDWTPNRRPTRNEEDGAEKAP